MHEHVQQSGNQPNNLSGESSDKNSKSGKSLREFAYSENIPIESIGSTTVAVDHNPEQTLVLVESSEGTAAIAVDEQVDLEDALEGADKISSAIERVTRQTFATDGGSGA